MKSEDEQMIQRIMDTDTMGYASVYDSGSGKREEYLVALTAENLASLIGRKGGETRQITVTDVLDRLVADSRKGTLDNCPDQRLCGKEAYRDPGLRLEERACVFGEKVREFSHAVEEGCGQEVPSAQLAQRM